MGERIAQGLVKALKRYTETAGGTSPFVTAVPGLTILRANRERRPQPLIFKPALCLSAQGAKRAIFGDSRFDYPAGRALLVSLEMPGAGTVIAASPSEPFLGLVLEFDLAIMRDVLKQLPAPPKPPAEGQHGVCVIDVAGPLADCIARIVSLLDRPEAIPILYPAIMRELSYWTLAGPQGGALLSMAMANPQEPGVVRALHALRSRFAESVRVEELANIARMSPTVFHRHFKAVTSMTPLQYQKQMRLIEARRLMLSEPVNVESAAFQVGYESPSQFSREYARMFGSSPRRDVAALRIAAA